MYIYMHIYMHTYIARISQGPWEAYDVQSRTGSWAPGILARHGETAGDHGLGVRVNADGQAFTTAVEEAAHADGKGIWVTDGSELRRWC